MDTINSSPYFVDRRICCKKMLFKSCQSHYSRSDPVWILCRTVDAGLVWTEVLIQGLPATDGPPTFVRGYIRHLSGNISDICSWIYQTFVRKYIRHLCGDISDICPGIYQTVVQGYIRHLSGIYQKRH